MGVDERSGFGGGGEGAETEERHLVRFCWGFWSWGGVFEGGEVICTLVPHQIFHNFNFGTLFNSFELDAHGENHLSNSFLSPGPLRTGCIEFLCRTSKGMPSVHVKQIKITKRGKNFEPQSVIELKLLIIFHSIKSLCE